MANRLRIGIVGEPVRPGAEDLAAAVASRLEAGGAEVHFARVGSGTRSTAGVAAVEVAPAFGGAFDAGVDCCVADDSAKKHALNYLEEHLARGAPLLTCCHAASATRAAARCADPSMVVGFALLAPSDERETVECARALQTSDAAAEVAATVWRAAGLEPAWVGDGAGLVTPRIVACLANEALFALGENVAEASDIDLAMRLGTRYPRGPLRWAADIGLDQVLAVLDALAAEHGEDRYRAAPLLRRLVDAGRGEVT